MRRLRVCGQALVCTVASCLAATPGVTASDDQRLIQAARRQDHHALRALLEARADVTASQADGTTALHWAAHWDDLDSARLLVRAGAPVGAPNQYYGVTPLSLATANGSAAMVRLLLEAGADANATQRTGESVLMTAARTGNVDVVRALLDRGANPNHAQAGTGQTALMWAVAEEHPDAAGELLRRGASVSARTTGGFTPLLFAAREPNLDSVRRLLDAGANVNEAATDGSSPLVVATVRGRIDVATLLLERGADPDAAGSGYTALHWAAGSWPTILSGATGIVSDDEEWRAMAGLTKDKVTFVKTLLTHGADANARLARMPPRVGIGSAIRGSLTGATPFLLAAMAADTGTMRVLLEHGADPRLTTAQQITPLMLAAGLSREVSVSFVTEAAALDAVRLMLSIGADINAANAEGDTALHGAAFIKSDAVVRLLVEAGAAVNAANARGETPLTAAEQVVQGGSRVRAQTRTSTGDLLRELGGR